uniref:Sulfotransferase domain-containing protein n=1 Tax=Craspedostauros australis TaxID=1486917 RepID=A0A7R9WPE7_9STRA|mmetsp:Transcript_13041/g.35975  ORF Transcript_13041/g.35975 Transcript_13041/m.35975 type:complete len:425 (+) Transcript_13041:146-1420(+)
MAVIRLQTKQRDRVKLADRRWLVILLCAISVSCLAFRQAWASFGSLGDSESLSISHRLQQAGLQAGLQPQSETKPKQLPLRDASSVRDGWQSASKQRRQNIDVNVNDKALFDTDIDIDIRNPFGLKHHQHDDRKHHNVTIRILQQRSLPTMKDGGFIFFLHVPKTGGTTFRVALERMQNTLEYGFIPGRGIWDTSLPAIEKYVNSPPSPRKNRRRHRKLMVIEVHGRDAPHLLELLPHIRRWRESAARNKIPTFFFTILREPVSYAFSYFNFFYVQRKNTNFPNVAATQANFLKFLLWNPQCQFLARGEYSLRKKEKQQPTVQECDDVYAGLLEMMDWIGTTDRMSTETLPLLAKILRVPTAAFEPQMVTTKDRTTSIGKDQMSAETMDLIREQSAMDTKLYESIRSVYNFGMWRDAVDGTAPP